MATSPTPAPQPPARTNWGRVVFYSPPVALVVALVGAAIFLGGLRSDVKAARQDIQALNNPIDSRSLRFAVEKSSWATQILGTEMFDIIGELHRKPREADVLRKHRADYDRRLGDYRPLNSLVKEPAYLEPSEVNPQMVTFRIPFSGSTGPVLVEPLLRGRIRTITEEDGHKTVEVDHGPGFISRYNGLTAVMTVIKKVGDDVVPGNTMIELSRSSDASLSVGLIGPDGKFIHPLLPLLANPPKPPAEATGPKARKSGPR